MKIVTLFLVIGFGQLHCQNIDLKQLMAWRDTNYQIVQSELVSLGWEKGTPKDTVDIYRSAEFYLHHWSQDEKVLTLMYTNDYQKDNNSLTYSGKKEDNYDNFLNQITSAGFEHFRTMKTEAALSECYNSDKITIILTSLNVTAQIHFFAIHVCTNAEYKRTYGG